MIEMEGRTPYDWCLENNMRILDLNPTDEEWYFKDTVTKEDFIVWLGSQRVKPNSTPRKTAPYLEYRMYGLVNYQLSGTIHAGIQYGHSVVDYSRNVAYKSPIKEIYNKWADYDKTFIILNGGTTNNNPKRLGSLNKHMQTLIDNNVLVQPFYEPDLNDALTSFCFLVDERVYDKELYKKFEPETIPWSKSKPSDKQLSDLEVRNTKNYLAWEEKIGGPKNSFLRGFLRNFKLI